MPINKTCKTGLEVFLFDQRMSCQSAFTEVLNGNQSPDCYKTCIGYDAEMGMCYKFKIAEPVLLVAGNELKIWTIKEKKDVWWARGSDPYGKINNAINELVNVGRSSEGSACASCSMFKDNQCVALGWIKHILRQTQHRTDNTLWTKNDDDYATGVYKTSMHEAFGGMIRIITSFEKYIKEVMIDSKENKGSIGEFVEGGKKECPGCTHGLNIGDHAHNCVVHIENFHENGDGH